VHWASEGGPAPAALGKAMLTPRRHPEQGLRACLGVLRLGKQYGVERLQAACARALALAAPRFRSVQSVPRPRPPPAAERGRATHRSREYPRPQVLPLSPRGADQAHPSHSR
jgi:hypothetical protein